MRYILLLLACLVCVEVQAAPRARAVCGVHQQKVFAVNQFQAVPLLQPIYQVGAGLKQEAVEEHGFRQSSGSVKRLLELEAYYAGIQDIKYMMEVQHGQVNAQPEQAQVTLEQRYPVFAAKCLSCHNSPDSKGGVLVEGELTREQAGILLDRAYNAEMPPGKPLTPAEFDAFKFEMIGDEEGVVTNAPQPEPDCTQCQQPAPEVSRWSAPATPQPAAPAPATPPVAPAAPEPVANPAPETPPAA